MPTSPCVLWTGATNGVGYGMRKIGGKTFLTHRLAYEEAYGPIPAGLELDHLCRTPLCMNPDHLEAVTHAENVRRGNGWSGVHARKTHCPRGHPYDLALATRRGRVRGCRQCKNALWMERYWAKYRDQRRSRNNG